MFGERVEDLAREAQRLRARRVEFDVAVSATADSLSDEAVRAIHADMSSTTLDAPEPIKKALAQAFVHELRVLDRRTEATVLRPVGPTRPPGQRPTRTMP